MPSGPAGSAAARGRLQPLLATVLIALASRQAWAQSTGIRQGTTNARSVELGRINFYPSLLIDYGYESNVFYSSGETAGDEIIPSRLFVLQPRFSFDLPLGESWMRWSYSPVYRNYSSDAFVQEDPWSHFFDLDGRLRFGSRGFTSLKDHFVMGTQELREVDPGGELTFGLTPFRVHEPSVEVGMDVGARQAVSVIWSYDSTQFDQSVATSVYNYRGWGLEGRYTYKMSPATNAYLYYGRKTTTQDRGGGDADKVDIANDSTGVGLIKTLNRNVVTQASFGYLWMDFTNASPTNYSGPVFSASASWQVDDITRIAFDVRRQPYQSFYLNNNFYLNRTLFLSLTRQTGTSMFWTLGVGVETNVYSETTDAAANPTIFCADDGQGGLTCPSDGQRRRDRGWRAETGVGFKIGQTSRGFIGYNYGVRSSNILQAFPEGFADPFAYTVSTFSLRVETGWL
jgi:Putative beta-barrel porin 2